MTINSINGTGTQAGWMGMNQAADSYSRNIQSQISNAQKQLQELSSNEDMSSEDKTKKRQEIQKQINDLNVQLRQHQTEQRREKQQTKDSSMNETSAGTKNAGDSGAGLSQVSMTAIISGDNSIKQARVQHNVATRMEGKARVLRSEIKQDAGNEASVEKKQEELAELEQKAQTATASQISTLADANRTDKISAADEQKEKTSDQESENTQTGASEAAAAKRPGTSVDIRL